MSDFGPLMHMQRQTKRELTVAERLGQAQKTSLRYRNVDVKLPTAPWDEDSEE